MEISQEHKDNVKRKILETLVKGLEDEEIDTKDLPAIGEFVIEEMKKIVNNNDMISFLQKLSAQWRIFSIVLVLESGEYKLQEERQAVDTSLQYLKKGLLNKALEVVKAVQK